MHATQQIALAAKFPELLKGHPDAPCNTAAGIACGNGWHGLLVQLFEALTPLLADNAGLSNPPRLYEVRTQKNRLRILLRPMTPEMSSYVYQAMSASEAICEACGSPKERNTATSLCGSCQTRESANPSP